MRAATRLTARQKKSKVRNMFSHGLLASMEGSKRLARRPVYPMLIAVSLFRAGTFSPRVNGPGRIRAGPLPWVGRTALAITVAGVALHTILPWLPVKDQTLQTNRMATVRLKLQTMLAGTADATVLIAALTKHPKIVRFFARPRLLLSGVPFPQKTLSAAQTQRESWKLADEGVSQ